ncbi:unnamed protein product [Prorocentrum cordatum]|uniref:SIS domain-containing protein n=1 Tax=Prorocentrum cordatum TaxID=2364126 RepID=A0ABN9S471_9DINO|nr:unnamed protein product [Polarella glacialis]
MESCSPCFAGVDHDAAGAAPARRNCAALLGVLFGRPTLVTACWLLICAARSRRAPEGAPWLAQARDAVLFEASLRAARAVALLLHELAHLLAAGALLLPSARLRLLAPAGPEPWLRRLARQLLPHLLPLAAAPGACVALTPRARKALLARGAGAEASVRAAGLAASLLLPCGLGAWLGASLGAGDLAAVAALAGALLVAAGALLSDLPGGPLWGPAALPGCFCCGNWGLLVPRDALQDGGGASRELFPGVCESLLLSVLDIVEMRGAQAGGVATFLSNGGDQVKAVVARSLKTKRGRLGTKIFNLFRSRLRWQYRAGLMRCRELRGLPVVLAQGHSRFGTSSGPAEVETHPHQWLGPRFENVWRCDENHMWRREHLEVCTTITHNGDFDGWKLYDKVVPNGILGLFLERALHCSSDAKGDSPKLAGMMDLLLCQGMWLASVRLAFVTEVTKHVDEVFGWEPPSRAAPNHVPLPASFARWAGVFDRFFGEALRAGESDAHEPTSRVGGLMHSSMTVKGQFAPTRDEVKALADKIVEFFEQPQNAADMQPHGITGIHLKNFVQRACGYFFCMDLLSTVQLFFQRAEGTFGISVSCTLWPASIVLASKGQPISLGIDQTRPLAIWSSEPSSLLVGWPALDARGLRTRAARARWDLNDATGEALELRIVQGGTADQHLAKLRGPVSLGAAASSHFFPMPTLDTQKVMDHHLLVRGVSLDSAARPLTMGAFVARWVLLQAPPPSRKLGSSQGGLDPVARDLHDVPSVLQQVEDAWKDRASLNHQSGRRFGRCLAELLARKRREGGGVGDSIDVLVFGIENSLWLGQQFAADLKRMMPLLNVTALSSNWLLGMLQEAQGHLEPRNFAISRLSFGLSQGALVLGISHSGTTYPTVWAARALHRRHGERANLFAMSSQFDTVAVADSIGHDLMKLEFTGCLFSTMAGQRPSEPSTVATLAMHHTLSWLLCVSAEVVSTAFPAGAVASGAARATKADRGRPWVGTWVDTTKGFFHGDAIRIGESSWHLEGSRDHVHSRSVFAIGRSSEDGVQLIESFPDGSEHVFDVSCEGERLRVVLAGARSSAGGLGPEAGAGPVGGRSLALQGEPGEPQDRLLSASQGGPASPHAQGLRRPRHAAPAAGSAARGGGAVRREQGGRGGGEALGAAVERLARRPVPGVPPDGGTVVDSLLLSAVYVYITVTLGYPLFSAAWGHIGDIATFDDYPDEWWWVAISYIAAHLDAHLYVFMGACLATAHRLCTGRRLFVRYSGKTLVIVDCTVNYKLLRAYVSKLRALAFRFTTFGVLGQNGEDHFVHEMTHLTTSDVIILAGRADGRLGTLASMEAASIMSLQQARFIAANPNTGVEIVSVGHNPWMKPGLFQKSVTLSSEHRPAFYSQKLLRSEFGGHAPADVMHGVAMLVEGDLSGASTRGNEAPFQDVRIEDIKQKMRSQTIDFDDAQVVISEFVKEYSTVLDIEPEDFDITQVLDDDVAVHLTSSQVRKGSRTIRGHAPQAASAIATNMCDTVVKKLSPVKFFARQESTLSQHPPQNEQPQREDSRSSGIFSNGSEMATLCQGPETFSTRSPSSKRKTGVFKFTASNIMVVLRGRNMEKIIAQMQLDQQKRFALARHNMGDVAGNAWSVLKACYEEWADFVAKRGQERADRQTENLASCMAEVNATQPLALPKQAAWRTQEEFRQRKRQWMMHYSALPFSMPYSTHRCFDLWRENVETMKAQTAMSEAPTSKVGSMRGMQSLGSRMFGQASSIKHSTSKTYSPTKKHSPSKTYIRQRTTVTG